MTKIEYSDKELAKSLKKYAKKFDVLAVDMIKDLAYKSGYEFAKYTQPFGVGLKAKNQGLNAVERDIEKIYRGIPKIAAELKRKAPKHAKIYMIYIQRGEFTKADEYADKHLNNIVSSSFDNGSLHKRQRRKGRIAKQGYKASATSRRTRIDSYVIKQQKKVALAKGSWVQSIDGLSLNKRRVPKWLQNSPIKTGSHTIKKRGWGSSVTLISTIPYMSNVLRSSRISGIIRRVSRNHTKHLKKLTLK